MTKEKACLNCGVTFKAKRKTQLYCQSACGVEYRTKQKEAQKQTNKNKKLDDNKEDALDDNVEDETTVETLKTEDLQHQELDDNKEDALDNNVEDETIVETLKTEGLQHQELDDNKEDALDDNVEDETIVETLKTEGLQHQELDDNKEDALDDNVEDETIVETLKTEGLQHQELDDDVDDDDVDDDDVDDDDDDDGDGDGDDDDGDDDGDDDDDVFDLSKYLSTHRTKEKAEVSQEEGEEQEEEPPLDNEDFDQEELERIEENKSKNLSISRDLETDAVKVMMAPQKAAKVSISFLSAINDLGLPFLHKKASFTKGEESHLKNLARLSKQKKLDKFSDEDHILLAKWNEHEEYKELVPLDEDEKADLAIPLEELFKSSDGKGMSPFWALIIVVMTILSSRLVPVGQAFAERGKNNFGRLESEKEQNHDSV